MNNGQRVAATAVDLATPFGSVREKSTNDDGPAGWIRTAQLVWGMGAGTNLGPQPWCDMGADKIFKIAGVDDAGILHPSTAETCRRADRLGGLAPKSERIHPGTVLVKCSVHITTVVHDDGSGFLDCVGCNESDMIRRSRRAKSWGRLFEVPGLREGEPEKLVEYWFEDPAALPEYYGGYDTRAYRARVLELPKFQKAVESEMVRVVQEPDGEFGFFVFSGRDSRWGPWVGTKDGPMREARDKALASVEKDRGIQLRARSRPIANNDDVDFSDGRGGGADETSTQ